MDKQIKFSEMEPGMFVELSYTNGSELRGRVLGRTENKYRDSVRVLADNGCDYSWDDTPGTSIRQLETIPGFQDKLMSAVKSGNIPKSFKSGYNGADPEVFVLGGDGEVFEAWKFLPAKVKGATTLNYSLVPYWDGFQAEFQLNPSECLNFQNDQMYAQLTRVLTAARRYDPRARLTPRSTLEIPLVKLLQAKDEHVALGCAPSYNAYDLQGDVPMDARQLTFRFAGGHIHRSFPKLSQERARQIVRTVDAIVGVPSITMFQQIDNPVRRKFYGLPGEFRLPAHGLEYRVLSSAWECHPAIAQFVRDLTRCAMHFGYIGVGNVFDYAEAEVVSIILDHDVDAAKKFVARNSSQYKTLLELLWSPIPARKGFDLLSRPVNDFVNPEAMETNWRIGQEWLTDSSSPGTRWANFQ